MKNRFEEMSDSELCKVLKEYAEKRNGEIAGLTYAAAVRIGVLAARVKVLEEGDDRK